jgi:hypothetical protein
MYAIKNIQFTRLYKVNGYLKEFNFRKSNASLEGTVSVDTIDERGNRIMFFMEKKDSGWSILPQELPNWISEQEPNLDEALKAEIGG